MSKTSRKKSATANSGKSSTAKSAPATRKKVKASKPKRKVQPPPVDKLPPPKAALIEGRPAPAFSLPRDGGRTVSLSDFKGRKLVVFFYPRADTPGCTLEAKDFSRLAPQFESNKTAVLGVSADALPAQERFRDKHKLAVPLASDEKLKMLKAYGAWGEKSMYGKTFMGVLRSTVLIGQDGAVARVWRGVKVDGHAQEVLAAARAL